jgi:hypothetical protein
MSMPHARIIRFLALALVLAAVLAGGALAASGGLRASQLDVIFDDVPVGSTSAAQQVTVTNEQHGPVDVGRATIVRPHPRDFLLSTDTCSGRRLEDGEQCKLAIRFRPTASGTRVAHLKLPHDGDGCAVWITLAGSGPNQQTARTARCDDDKPPATQPGSTGSTGSSTTSSTDGSQTASTNLASSAIRLPAAARACKSRRIFKIRIRQPRGVRFEKVTVRLNRKLISVRRGRRVTASVSLKGLPRGRFTLRVVATTASGRAFSRTRHYVTCVKSKG